MSCDKNTQTNFQLRFSTSTLGKRSQLKCIYIYVHVCAATTATDITDVTSDIKGRRATNELFCPSLRKSSWKPSSSEVSRHTEDTRALLSLQLATLRAAQHRASYTPQLFHHQQTLSEVITFHFRDHPQHVGVEISFVALQEVAHRLHALRPRALLGA